MTKLRAIVALVLAVLVGGPALADPFIHFHEETLLICAATEVAGSPPDPADPICEPARIADINAIGRTIWVMGTMTPSPELLQSDQPIGLFVAAKSASRVYLNGDVLGQNGRPGLSAADEAPGAIDAVFHVPRDRLVPGENVVALLMSGHHAQLDRGRPVLLLGLFEYLEPPYHERDNLWLTSATLGLFLIAGIYASVLAGLRLTVLAAAPLALTCVFAGGQVIAESLRSVWAYPYPVHDLRLIAISLCGFGTGMALATHVAFRLEAGHKTLVLSAIALISLVGVATTHGFDAIASRALLIPNILTVLLALWQARRGDLTAVLYAAGFLVFVGLNLVDPGEFLDVNYFLALSALVVFLTVLQAVAYRSAVLDHADADRRRRQLERALEQASSRAEPVLTLRHSGRIDQVKVSDIVSLAAAGDYVSITLASGRELLPTTSLSALEKELPEHFVRVHRSFLVNSHHIVELVRSRDRTGALKLSNDRTVPVSRRIMPTLRKALSSQGETASAAPPAAPDTPSPDQSEAG